MRGQFIKKDRLDFTGIIANDCKGTIVFPDQYSKSFTYIEEEYKIVWGNELNGEVWNKGKNFPSLGLIQVKDPSQKKKKVISIIMKETMKNIQSEKVHLTSGSQSCYR